MSKNQKSLYINIFLLITLCLFLVAIFLINKRKDLEIVSTTSAIETQKLAFHSLNQESKNETAKIDNKKIENQQSTQIESNSFTLLAGEIKVQISFIANTLLYDALLQARDMGKIEFLGKNYPGLGFFVTDIGTLHSGNGKHLIYYINGKEATVGVSSYTLKDGDIIQWKLE